MKYYIWIFCENLSRKLSFIKIRKLYLSWRPMCIYDNISLLLRPFTSPTYSAFHNPNFFRRSQAQILRPFTSPTYSAFHKPNFYGFPHVQLLRTSTSPNSSVSHKSRISAFHKPNKLYTPGYSPNDSDNRTSISPYMIIVYIFNHKF